MICLLLLLQLRVLAQGDSLVTSGASANLIDRGNYKPRMFLRQNTANLKLLPLLKIVEGDSVHTKQELISLLCNFVLMSNEWTDFRREQLNEQIILLSKMSPIEQMSLREKRRLQIYGNGGDGVPKITQVNVLGLIFAK